MAVAQTQKASVYHVSDIPDHHTPRFHNIIVGDYMYTKTVCTSVGSTNVKMLC